MIVTGQSRNPVGQVVVREGDIHQERAVFVRVVLDPRCPCERDRSMCFACSGPETMVTVHHTDADF